MTYRLTLIEKSGESIHSTVFEDQNEAFEEMKKHDLTKFQVTLEKLDDAKS
jgi:hypothetical protein